MSETPPSSKLLEDLAGFCLSEAATRGLEARRIIETDPTSPRILIGTSDWKIAIRPGPTGIRIDLPMGAANEIGSRPARWRSEAADVHFLGEDTDAARSLITQYLDFAAHPANPAP